MNDKPKVTPEIIKDVELLISGKGTIGLKKMISQLKEAEPHLWDWLKKSANEDVAGLMQKGLTMLPDVTELFGGLFIKSRLCGFLLAEVANDRQWLEKHSISLVSEGGKVGEDPVRKFDSWIAGKLDESYYLFNDPDPEKEPNKFLAAKNFKERKKEAERKKIEHEERIRKTAEIKSVEKEAGISSDTDLPSGVSRKRTRKLTDLLNRDKDK